jgi:hypothetical protein
MPLHPTRYAEMLSKKYKMQGKSMVNQYRLDQVHTKEEIEIYLVL